MPLQLTKNRQSNNPHHTASLFISFKFDVTRTPDTGTIYN